ncbi:MAG: helix-turn-helix domain-containing protein [Bacteroidales bacterium]
MNSIIVSDEYIPKSFRSKIGFAVKSFREQKGYSQDELAVLMKVNRSTISKIENGKFAVSIDYLERLSLFLDFDIQLQKL